MYAYMIYVSDEKYEGEKNIVETLFKSNIFKEKQSNLIRMCYNEFR